MMNFASYGGPTAEELQAAQEQEQEGAGSDLARDLAPGEGEVVYSSPHRVI